jgi:ethanolamine permease
VAWAFAVLPYADFDRLFDLAPTAGNDAVWPRGLAGIVAALPAAAWFYLAIESVPLAAEETIDPARNLPRGMLAAIATLVALSLLVLVLAPASAGTAALAASDHPLPEAVAAVAGRGFVYGLTTAVGLLGLLASFFSLVFAYSRQIFALSRAGYLPRWLSRTNRFHAPHYALIVPALLGYGILRGVDVVAAGRVATADLLVQIAVFCALVSYVLMMVSHLVLRVRAPDLPRPYRTPGGPVLPIVALARARAALTASLFHAAAAAWVVAGAIGLLALGMAWFALVSRHRLVATAPEEEAALVRAAEAELDRPAD